MKKKESIADTTMLTGSIESNGLPALETIPPFLRLRLFDKC